MPDSAVYLNDMASWKITLLMLCIIMAMLISVCGRLKDKRLHMNRNDEDKVARGAIGA